MTYIHDQPPEKPKKVKKKLRFAGIAVLVIVLLLGLATYIYFLILPPRQDKHYLSIIRPVYNQQAAQMALVYKTFNNSNPTTDNLDQINLTIKKALILTNNLKAQNNLNVLPGTEALVGVSQTVKRYTAMQQYVNDSLTFLTNYQADLGYVNQLKEVGNSSQLAAFLKSMDAINTATTASQLLPAAQNASADLSNLISSLKQLKPGIDFQQTSASLSTSVNDVNNDFIDTISGISSEDAEQVANSKVALNRATAALHGFPEISISSMFNPNSVIYQEMIGLQAEHPLHSSKP